MVSAGECLDEMLVILKCYVTVGFMFIDVMHCFHVITSLLQTTQFHFSDF